MVVSWRGFGFIEGLIPATGRVKEEVGIGEVEMEAEGEGEEVVERWCDQPALALFRESMKGSKGGGYGRRQLIPPPAVEQISSIIVSIIEKIIIGESHHINSRFSADPVPSRETGVLLDGMCAGHTGCVVQTKGRVVRREKRWGREGLREPRRPRALEQPLGLDAG